MDGSELPAPNFCLRTTHTGFLLNTRIYSGMRRQELTDPAPGNDFARVVVGMIGVLAALADKLGLRDPVSLFNFVSDIFLFKEV